MARSFFGAREATRPLPQRRNALRDMIVIAVGSLDQMEVPRADSIKVLVTRRDGERAALAHLHTPRMGPRRFEFGRNDGPHPVARLKAAYLLLPHLIPTREPLPRPVGAAMVAPSGGRDRQRFEPARPDARQIPDAQGIEGMGLPDCEPRPVPPGPPARPGADGQLEDAQGLDQLEPGRVDRRRVLEWAFGSLLHLRVAKLNGRLVPFGGVAVMTAERQICDAVRASATAWEDVVKLERAVGLPAIGTPVLVLDEQIRPGLPSSTRALLVLGAADLRILQELGVESDTLHLDAARGRPADQPVRPGDGIANPGAQGRGQPADRHSPIVEARRPVPQVGASAAPAGVSLRDFVLMDPLAAVADFAEKDGMMDGSLLRLLHAGQRDARRLRSGIDFERERLERSVFHTPIFEANDERLHPVHHGTAPLEQESRPFGRAGHQWVFLLI